MGLSNKVLDGVVWDNIVAVAIFHLSFLAAAYLLFNHEKYKKITFLFHLLSLFLVANLSWLTSFSLLAFVLCRFKNYYNFPTIILEVFLNCFNVLILKINFKK